MKKPASTLFVILPYLVQSEGARGNNTRSVLAFPYGVLSIASYINTNARSKPTISILDLNLYAESEMAEILGQYLEKTQADIVGLSMMFDLSYKHINWIAEQVKKHNDKTLVVLGGSAATVSWDIIPREQNFVDALCYTEGEYTMCRLVDSENAAETLMTDPAWVTKKSLAERQIPQPRYVENINEVIGVDYSFINTKSYSMKEAFSPFSSIRNAGDVRQFYLVTSRGCPFKCVFCAEPSFHGKKMRYADVDVLIAHVRTLVEKYGMNVLAIYDDQILLNRVRAKEFFRRLAEFKIRVETPNGLSAAYIDEEMAVLMRAAGIDTVPLAIESGSSRVLHDIIHKPLRLEQVKPVVEYLHRNSIFVQGYFIVGLPGEREEDRDETVRFAKEVGLDWSGFNLATPLRGSELYRICTQNGYIDAKFGLGDLGMHDYVIKAPGLDPAYIKRKRYMMNLDVNFVNNYRMKVGDHQMAIACFQDVLARYENHAFAYYYLAKAMVASNKDMKQVVPAMDKVCSIVEKEPVWGEYFKFFNIKIQQQDTLQQWKHEYSV